MTWEVAVIGGGLAGAATALRLAQAGRRVALFERQAQAHDKVCGEFLSGDTVAELAALGVDPSALDAVSIDRVHLRSGYFQAEAPLPFLACGLSRRRLDEVLLQRAADAGAVVRRGVAVRALRADGAGIRLDRLGEAADSAVLATGKHDLRDWSRPVSDLIGLKLHLRLTADRHRRLAGTCELHLFDGGYAGLLPIESGMANLCMVVTRDHYRRLGRDWRAVIRPITPLAAQLDGAEAISARPLSVAGMPYGHLVADRDRRPVYRVGDQAAVIHSFTGDGMAIALRSARLAATALLEGKEASAYHQQLAGELRRALALAGSVDALAHGWFTRQLLLLACRALPGLIGSIALRTRVVSNRPPQWT